MLANQVAQSTQIDPVWLIVVLLLVIWLGISILGLIIRWIAGGEC
jgi:hypothetical protein